VQCRVAGNSTTMSFGSRSYAALFLWSQSISPRMRRSSCSLIDQIRWITVVLLFITRTYVCMMFLLSLCNINAYLSTTMTHNAARSFPIQTTPSMCHLYFARSFFVRQTIAREFFREWKFAFDRSALDNSAGECVSSRRFSPLYSNRVRNEFWMATQQLLSLTYLLKDTEHCFACFWTSDSLMSSSIHSSVSSSSDVAILPAMTNHLHQNHIESPSKSLKRSRSPSLTRDEPNDNEHSSTTIETPTKRSRKKRTTNDIDQSLGLVAPFGNERDATCSLFLDDIYPLINFMSIDGPTMNLMPTFMSCKNKYVIISL
jgi:hypothetical protein